MSSYIPTGYTQSSGSNPLQSNPRPLQFSLIGDPTPGAYYARIRGMQKAMFPYRYPTYGGPTGPLRSNGGN